MTTIKELSVMVVFLLPSKQKSRQYFFILDFCCKIELVVYGRIAG